MSIGLVVATLALTHAYASPSTFDPATQSFELDAPPIRIPSPVAHKTPARPPTPTPKLLHSLRIQVASDGPPPTPTATAIPSPTPTPIRIDTRIAAVDAFLAGSPLAGYGAVFVAAADTYQIDWRLMPAISLHESSRGFALCGSFNPFGYGPCINFDSFSTAIHTATRTFAGYQTDTSTGLCIWVSGSVARCDYSYVGRVLYSMSTMVAS